LIDVGSAVAAKIALDVANEGSASPMVFELQVQAGELCRCPEFSDISLRSVAERYGGEIGGDVTLRVRGSKYIFEVNEPAGGENSFAEFDGP
jgi:hypothetical protein